jgi:hypothetical protein
MEIDKYKELLRKRDGVYHLIKALEEDFTPGDVITKSGNENIQNLWQNIGLDLIKANRYYEATEVFFSLYKKLIQWQIDENKWPHKAMPLVWISDCFLKLGYRSLAKRFMMLTMVDDSIRDIKDTGSLLIDKGGTYFRLRYYYGMGHEEIMQYSMQAYEVFSISVGFVLFPEYILQQLDNDWMIETPSTAELSLYLINPLYIEQLQDGLGMSRGINLELISSYLMTSMPGCRTYMRKKQVGNSTDYDVVGSIDGIIADYRSELGRYFICECKDWEKPADFTTMSKLCRILSSTKIKFGILFAKNGISGEGKLLQAEREQRKVFQDSDIIIVVISNQDIESVKKGKNLIGLLRSKYEAVRLDLPIN